MNREKVKGMVLGGLSRFYVKYIQKLIGIYCLLGVCLLMGAFMVSTTAAKDSELQRIRVGWYEDSYNITGPNGERSGYGYEYQQAVASYTSWRYQYVPGGWSDLLKKVQTGEIDLMSGVSYTPERAQHMLFSELPMGREKYYLYANLKHTGISASNLGTLNGKRIALMEGSVQADQFYQWEKAHGLQLKYVFVNGFETGKAMVENGQVDCLISTETPLWVEMGLSAIATTGGSDIYFVINPQRPDIKETLDSAMQKMDHDKPFYGDELYQRYLSATSTATLSQEEVNYLASHGTIRIGCLREDYSISRKSPQDGKIYGVVNDYMDFAQHSLEGQHVHFELVEYDTIAQELKALQSGEIDLIFHFVQNPYVAEQNDVILSNTVLTMPVAAITAKDNFDEGLANTVAINQDDLLQQWYVSYNYPTWKVVLCPSQEKAEELVLHGEADCLLAKPGQMASYLDRSDLKSVYLYSTNNISFGVDRDNTMLLSILNQTLNSVPVSTMTGAMSKYDNMFHKVTVRDFIRDNPIKMAGTLTTVFAIILIITLVYLRRSRQSENMAQEAAAKAQEAAAQAQSLNIQLQQNHEALEKALVRAEAANAAKTTFLSHMSHDIRTPMNAIIGFTNIAQKHTASQEVKNCLDKIAGSSELLLTLINDVLDISRIESGHARYAPVVVDIRAVVDAALNIAHGLLSNRNLTFDVQRCSLPATYVMADPVRLREVLVNIISNAIKFTDDGGTISFTCKNTLSGDGKTLWATYTIADTGIGMSPEFQQHIFDEFSQEHSDARTQYKGTGLGMAITKRYVELMGGTIDLASQKGHGTTFVIRLPFDIVSQEYMDTQDAPVLISQVAGIRVLLAEDNDLNAEIATVQLEEIGLVVTRATDGADVVKTFADNLPGSFDIILMDIMMPKMNGYEATRAIRNMKGRTDGQNIPILALTANAFVEDVQESIEAGMNGHLSKPIVIEEIVRAIARNI